MRSPLCDSPAIVLVGLLLLAMTLFIGFSQVAPTPVLAGSIRPQESPVDTPTPVRTTGTPPASPLPTPVPITEVFIPMPASGGQPVLGVPAILWQAGLGLLLVGLGLTVAWRRVR